MEVLGLFWLFKGVSNFVGYIMPKPSSWKNSSNTIQTIVEKDKGLSHKY